MIKFRTGDVVVAVTHFEHSADSSKSFSEGDEFIVEHCTASSVTFKNRGNFTYTPRSFELAVEDTSHYHPHHDLIIAWAKGAKIQYNNGAQWVDWDRNHSPRWFASSSYRVKPEKTKKELEIERIESEMRKLADDLNKLKGA